MTLEELSRLDYDGASRLLTAYAVDLKRAEKEMASIASEEELWASRVKLAETKGLADLAYGARQRLFSLSERKAAVMAQAAEFESDIRRLKETLPELKAKVRSIDPDRLLAELSLLAGNMPGEEANVEAAFADSQAEDALETLKRKMGLGGAAEDGDAASGGEKSGA